MPVVSVEKNPEALTMTVVAEFDASRQRVWEAYADPRQIERFWGPPGWPATFTAHDVRPGGRSTYVMTGPDGEVSGGYWEFLAVDAPRSFEVRDGFAGPDGTPNTDMPSMRMTYTFDDLGDRTRMTTTTHFTTLDELEQLIAMGMEEGMHAAMAQIDDVLADLASFAAGRGVEHQVLSDTRVRFTRIIRGNVEQVWRAHQEAELLQTWLLGPEGWTMPVCEVATAVGDSYRYEWQSDDGQQRFGFTGELLVSEPPTHSVSTEAMIGMDGPSVVNSLTLTQLHEGTLLTLVCTYPDATVRDMILATGMTDGMEASYARLESLVLV